jgi:DNA-binding MarR family transcriptional regulator
MARATPVQSVDRLIGEVCRLHHKRAHALLEALGLYRGQPRVLFALWNEEGLTHSDLAEHMRVSAATISKMVQRMEKTGFLVRRADDEDQRISRVYLTDAGRAVRDRVDAAFGQLGQETLAGFSDDECELLRGFLARIRDNLVTPASLQHTKHH